MASIYKRGHIWWIHYLIGGKSVSKSLRTSNERVALEKKKRLEALEITGQLHKGDKEVVLCDECYRMAFQKEYFKN